MSKNKIIALAFSVGVGLFILVLWVLGALEIWEDKSLDYRFKARKLLKPSPEIVIVNIDDNSIKKLGMYPWSRNLQAKLLDRILNAGAKAVVYDVLFLEADEEKPWADDEFAAVLKKGGDRVTLGFLFKDYDEYDHTKYIDPDFPIEKFVTATKVGFVNVTPDEDGVIRRISLVQKYKEKEYPSLATSALSVYFNEPVDSVLYKRNIPTDLNNQILINFCGGMGTFPYFSFCEVLEGKVIDAEFKDKIVIVGGTATGLFDFRPIPVSKYYPGVEVHATVVSNVLQGNALKQWDSSITGLLILFLPLLTGFIFGRLSSWVGGLCTLGVLALYFYVTNWLFNAHNIYAEFVAPAISSFFSYGGVMFYRFMTEEKEKRWIKKTFSQYLSPNVMEKIISDPAYLQLGGKTENLSVLFSDIRGFTTISESLKPEEVVHLLNEYLSKMVEVVFRHDGTLDKFIGDAVMAFWGAPIPQADHSKKAVLCAFDMLEELKKLQDKWRSEGKKIIEIGIGVNTGDMVVGNMGSVERMDYTVIGDNVNLASRLEGLNKEFGSRIIISESAYNEVKDIVEVEALGAVKVKGKEKAVEIYAVTGRKGQPYTIISKITRKKDKEEGGAKHPSPPPAKNEPFDPDKRVDFK